MAIRVSASDTLKAAVWQARASGTRQADIAARAGLHPTTVSKIINALEPIQPGDERVLRLARVLGISPLDAFAVVRERPR